MLNMYSEQNTVRKLQSEAESEQFRKTIDWHIFLDPTSSQRYIYLQRY